MPIDFKIENRIATVVLDNQGAMNAVNPEMRKTLLDLWPRIKADDDIWAVVITGAGDKAFCTGNDLKNSQPPHESHAELTFGRGVNDNLVSTLDTDKPLICAINGFAMGGGLELALACDIRIASDRAQFALPEVKIGAIPGSGGTQRLPRLVGLGAAMKLLLTGDRIGAEEARRIGLVTDVFAHEQLMPKAYELAERILANAPLAVRAVKRLVRQGLEMPLPIAIDAERQVWGLLRDTQDRLEGRAAFKEKRKPKFQGK